MGRLADAYGTFKTGTLWSSTGRCKGFATSNPGEASKIDAYVAALDRGEMTAAPPTLSTATGRGLVGMLDALADQIATAPLPPDPLPPPSSDPIPIGVSFGGIGYTDDPAKRGRMMDDTKAMGGRSLRMQWWRQTQCVDAIDQAIAKGLRMFTCVMPDYSSTIIDRARAKQYGTESANLFGDRVPDFEFWNEPDLTGTWTPEQWAQAAVGFYEGVEASQHPEVRVWQGALWTWKMNSGSTTEGAFAWWKRAYAEWDRMGVKSLPGHGCSGHMYGDMSWNDPRNALYGYFGPNGDGKATNCIRYLMDSYGDGDKPIICTEGGHGTPSAQPNSVRALFDLHAKGMLESFMVYSQWDDAAGTFGMRPSEGAAQRPAYDLYKSLVAAA